MGTEIQLMVRRRYHNVIPDTVEDLFQCGSNKQEKGIRYSWRVWLQLVSINRSCWMKSHQWSFLLVADTKRVACCNRCKVTCLLVVEVP